MLTWNDASHSLKVAQMDANHREFMDLLGAAATATDADFVARFDALYEHTRRHFDDESALMRACGFPAIPQHEGEHRRILGELAQLRRSCDSGRFGLARSYVEGMPGWFAGHLATMDSYLAACLKRTNAISAGHNVIAGKPAPTSCSGEGA